MTDFLGLTATPAFVMNKLTLCEILTISNISQKCQFLFFSKIATLISLLVTHGLHTSYQPVFPKSKGAATQWHSQGCMLQCGRETI